MEHHEKVVPGTCCALNLQRGSAFLVFPCFQQCFRYLALRHNRFRRADVIDFDESTNERAACGLGIFLCACSIPWGQVGRTRGEIRRPTVRRDSFLPKQRTFTHVQRTRGSYIFQQIIIVHRSLLQIFSFFYTDFKPIHWLCARTTRPI